MPLKFVTGEPALLIGKALVIADLHIGVEQDYRAAGIMMLSRTQEMQKNIEALIRKTQAKRLIILGDVKHKVPGIGFQEEREVPEFLERLSEAIRLEVVPGNHDGGLAKLCPGITLHPSEGFLLDKFYLSHGHTWPGKEALEAESIVIGHSHPQVEFIDRLGHSWRERAWIQASFSKKRLSSHYGKLPARLPSLLLMPAFSQLVGGWALNSQHDKGGVALGPIARCAGIRRARACMLDGTFLGEVSKI